MENFFNRDYLLNAGAAVLIMLAGYIAARLARRWLGSIIEHSRIKDDLLLKDFFLRTLSFTIIIMALLTALSQIGWDVRTFIAGLGITGIIIGFALKDVLSNFAAGLLLLIYRPFRAGETIEVEGTQGVVRELTIVNMQMVTTDGIHVIMPNSKVWGAKITNYSLSQSRRTELTIKVQEEHVGEAIEIILAALAEDKKVLAHPSPSVRVASIANSAATLIIWAWTRPEDFQAANSNQYLFIQSALTKADIPIL